VSWRLDPQMTELARTVFKSETLVVKRQQGQYLLEGTPYGQLEILSLSRKGCFLLAAQAPPRELPARELPVEIVHHFRRNGLRPWKYATADSISQVVLDLGAAQDSDPPDATSLWSPFLSPMAPGPEVIGKGRQALVSQLMAIISAARCGDPVPILAGPVGVGKHVITSGVARGLSLRPLELRLARLLIPRMLQTGPETLMDALLNSREHLTGRELLVMSDAELFWQLPTLYRGHFGQEISSLPSRALLLSTNPQVPPGFQAIRLNAVGLGEEEEITGFLACTMPNADSRLLKSARDMMVSSAIVPPFGVLPGRLRYLVELVAAWHGQDPTETVWTPDDVAAAVDLVAQAWADAAAGEDRDT
jgi:hypothetical protein